MIFIITSLPLFLTGAMTTYTLAQKPEENILTFSSVLGVTVFLWILALITSGHLPLLPLWTSI